MLKKGNWKRVSVTTATEQHLLLLAEFTLTLEYLSNGYDVLD